jgi:ferrous iron transport protein B
LTSFDLRGKAAESINASALASVSQVLTPLLSPMGVAAENWQATVGLMSGVMAKEVVIGTLNQLYTAENLTLETFDPDNFDLASQLSAAVTETWRQLKETLQLSALTHPVEASKSDGEMSLGAMGILSSKFGGDASAYSYLIFVLLYVPCVSVMGAIARESHRGWMMLSVIWGINVAYSLATLFYQLATFTEHPAASLFAIMLIAMFNGLFVLSLYLLRHRFTAPLPQPATSLRKNAPITQCRQGE